MEKEFKHYLDSSVFLLRQVRQMLKSHNKMFAVAAANGDVASASALLNNNIAVASIETVLGYEIVSQASDMLEKDTSPEEQEESVTKQTN
jgi:hypothetical protein